jgi:hypothetical protein
MHRREDNIKMVVRELGWEGEHWIQRTLVKAIMNILVA